MFKKFQKHINDRFSFLEGKRILLAVSGGIDSMVALYLFQQLKIDFFVAHCNFNLRGKESEEDEKFVKQFCKENNISFFVQSFETKKYAKENNLSIQVAARNLRYEWFYTLLEEQKLDFIVTAHHQDDVVETFLIHLTRGTGIEGLTGIPEVNGKIIRPLLPFSREEIEKYATENKIKWREDSSNSSDKYLRNRIRHDVVLILKELNSSFLQSFQNTINHLKQSKSVLDNHSKSVLSDLISHKENNQILNIKKLLLLENYQFYLYQWLSEYGFKAWNDIYDLVQSQTGKIIHSETHELLKNRNELILYIKSNSNNDAFFTIDKNQKEVKVPLKIDISNVSDILNEDTNCIFVDEDKLQFPLQIRKWNTGDYFYPKGMQGKKKLTKFFKDEKYSLLDKSNSWLLCSDNEIVWVINKRQDNRFLATNTTTNILQIKVH